MAKPILPDNLRGRICELYDKGHSTIEIFDSVIDESVEYVDSHEQLTRCISRITRKRSSGRHGENAGYQKYELVSCGHCHCLRLLAGRRQEFSRIGSTRQTPGSRQNPVCSPCPGHRVRAALFRRGSPGGAPPRWSRNVPTRPRAPAPAGKYAWRDPGCRSVASSA